MGLDINFLINSGKFNEAREKIDQLSDPIEQKLYLIDLESAKGNFQQQKEYALKLLENDDLEPVIKLRGHLALGWVAFRTGNYEVAMDHALTSQTIYYAGMGKSDDTVEPIHANILNLVGSIHAESGRLDQAITFYTLVKSFREQLDDERMYAVSLNNLAFALFKYGDLQQALDFYLEALDIFRNLDDDEGIAVTLSNIGEIYRFRAELDRSYKVHKQALELRKESGYLYGLGQSHRYMANILMKMDERDKAKEHIEESMRIWRELGNSQWLSMSLYIYGLLELKQGLAIDSILSEMEDLLDSNNESVIEHRYLLLLAKQSTKTNRMSELAKAQSYLDRIIKDPMLDFELRFEAMMEICDILFKEMKITESESIYLEVKDLLDRLESMARENNAFDKLIEVLFLKAKMSLIDMSYKKAYRILDDVENLVNEKAMAHYIDRIKQEKRSLREDMQKLNELLESNHSVLERARLLELTEYMQDAFKATKEVDNGS